MKKNSEKYKKIRTYTPVQSETGVNHVIAQSYRCRYIVYVLVCRPTSWMQVVCAIYFLFLFSVMSSWRIWIWRTSWMLCSTSGTTDHCLAIASIFTITSQCMLDYSILNNRLLLRLQRYHSALLTSVDSLFILLCIHYYWSVYMPWCCCLPLLPLHLLHRSGTVCRSSLVIAVVASFLQQTENRTFCPVLQLWLTTSHCTDYYYMTSLFGLIVTCPCSLTT